MATESKAEKSKDNGGGRGPAAPFIDLKEAIARAQTFFDREGKNLVPVVAAAEHWGYAAKSSGGRQTVSALAQFGLITDDGIGDSRRVRLSKTALEILLRESASPERAAALKVAARSPKLFAQILAKYPPAELPSDTTLRHYLITELNVNLGSAVSIIKNFRASISFAKLAESDMTPATDEASRLSEASAIEISIGDFVQWESGGALQFDKPRRVRAVDGAWVFIEGSQTGIPANEITVEHKGTAGSQHPPTLPLPDNNTTQRVATDEREWLRGPLSKDSSYRLLVSGDLGPKEIGKLIKLLEAQKDVLSDD